MKMIRFLQSLLICAALIFAAVVLTNQPSPSYSFKASASVFNEKPITEPVDIAPRLTEGFSFPAPAAGPGQESEPVVEPSVETLRTMAGSIKAGDTLDTSLRRLELGQNLRHLIISSLRGHLDFRRLSPRDCYSVQLHEDGSLKKFYYESGPLQLFSITQQKEGTYETKKEPVALESRTVRISGQVTSSLFAAFNELGEGGTLVYAFADIFASKLDFNTETRKGDRFSLIVDKYYKDSEFIGYGRISMATYHQTSGHSIEAYYYDSELAASGYYDREGKAVGSSFLRSPVPMGRVTSGFTYRRKHPITGKVKPHLGIDLAAPVGTPIMASGDGTIISIGRNKGNGRQIIIKHPGGYKTFYGHLSGYRKGLRRGSKVSKKQVIGYVGASGMATGPHLDYRISLNGVFKNPFSLDFKPKAELASQELQNFDRHAASLADQMIEAGSQEASVVLQVKSFTLAPDKTLHLL